jgi:hypothetical protein
VVVDDGTILSSSANSVSPETYAFAANGCKDLNPLTADGNGNHTKNAVVVSLVNLGPWKGQTLTLRFTKIDEGVGTTSNSIMYANVYDACSPPTSVPSDISVKYQGSASFSAGRGGFLAVFLASNVFAYSVHYQLTAS